ncbi:MAG: hypothetical protein SVV03_02700, partial [Candidatus Nanohaloarchaea archaeon]|nr:hypothetical protein [Candidatus Nanohaloarchaea archaeon]
VREFADRGFPNYLVKHERKDRTQEVLGQFMPRRLSEGQAEVLENVILVSKPRDGGVGRGVEVADNPEELPYQEESLHADITNEGIEIFKTEEDRILERFLESKDIELDKKPSEWIGDNFKPSYQFATAAIAGFALQALTAYALGDPIVGEGVNLSNAEAYEWLYGITGGLLEGDAVFRWGTGCSMLGKLGGLADTVYYKVTGKQFVETRAYDGCMRHVTAIEVVEDGLIVEDFGGYWRTAEEPKDADVDDLNKK